MGKVGTPRETKEGRSVPQGLGAAGGGEEPPHGCSGQDPPAAGAAAGIWHGAGAHGWPGTRPLCQPPDTKLGWARCPPSRPEGWWVRAAIGPEGRWPPVGPGNL